MEVVGRSSARSRVETGRAILVRSTTQPGAQTPTPRESAAHLAQAGWKMTISLHRVWLGGLQWTTGTPSSSLAKCTSAETTARTIRSITSRESLLSMEQIILILPWSANPSKWLGHTSSGITPWGNQATILIWCELMQSWTTTQSHPRAIMQTCDKTATMLASTVTVKFMAAGMLEHTQRIASAMKIVIRQRRIRVVYRRQISNRGCCG